MSGVEPFFLTCCSRVDFSFPVHTILIFFRLHFFAFQCFRNVHLVSCIHTVVVLLLMIPAPPQSDILCTIPTCTDFSLITSESLFS
jgi:hypothetical protein